MIEVTLHNIKMLSTGSDGGHIYVKGTGKLPGHEVCDIHAHFSSREDEEKFKNEFNGHRLLLKAKSFDFTIGIGGSINSIESWILLDCKKDK